jgi:hypothetical protein
LEQLEVEVAVAELVAQLLLTVAVLVAVVLLLLVWVRVVVEPALVQLELEIFGGKTTLNIMIYEHLQQAQLQVAVLELKPVELVVL